MDIHEQIAIIETKKWKQKMIRKPSITNMLSKSVQDKINSYIPEKVHQGITVAIKNMVRAVVFGSTYFSAKLDNNSPFYMREEQVKRRIDYYKKAAVLTGAGTGAGGFLLTLAEFPVFLGMKIKLLFDIAGLYGFDVKDYKERVFILYVFQVAFSSAKRRAEAFKILENWEVYSQTLPDDIHQFDWRSFQQEYRDYLDIAKLLQMIPGIGAIVGAIANNQIVKKLGVTAINAYRMRVLVVYENKEQLKVQKIQKLRFFPLR